MEPAELRLRALAYHAEGKPGKLELNPVKPCATAEDLSLAYTPGVAEPVLEIAKVPAAVYDYTAKGNLVGVITNGTAVLGLGNRGALAAKPVMEGKAVLFKRFADIDVFDIELDTTDPNEVIRTVKLLEPTFGGINLEDIKSPECFAIEQTLAAECSIPVFHDDQWGTAIICTAALINAAELAGKDLPRLKIVFNGAGAAALSCAKMFVQAGVLADNIIMCDTSGVLYKGRAMNLYQQAFAADTRLRTLEQAIKGADVFIGLSAGDCVTQSMVASMADKPIVFAMANPTPEISYDAAVSAAKDVIAATGRSDCPNQVNNVLCFPFLFRGALDVRARAITDSMKMNAARALAELAREPVPEEVRRAYGGRDFVFGREYIVPKPFDPRVIEYVAGAVVQAACDDGFAQKPIRDITAYKASLRKRMERFWQAEEQ